MLDTLNAVKTHIENDEALGEDTVRVSPMVKRHKQALYVWIGDGTANPEAVVSEDVASGLLDIAYAITHPHADYEGFLRRANNLLVWLQGRTFATDANGLRMNPSWEWTLEMSHDESVHIAEFRFRYALELWHQGTDYPEPGQHPLNLPEGFRFPATIEPVVEVTQG